MATRLITAGTGFGSAGTNTLKVNLVNSAGLIWDNVGLDLETYVAAQQSRYDISVTETAVGSGLYLYTIPATLPVGTYRERPRFTDTGYLSALDAFRWDGAVVTGSPSTNANITTVGELRTLISLNARNAGVIDSNNVLYSPVGADYAIQRCLEEFIQRTLITVRTDSVTMSETDSSIDFSAIAGFDPSRVYRIWSVPADNSQSGSCETIDIEVIDRERIDQYRDSRGDMTGLPGAIGFSLRDGTNKTARTADKDYTIRFRWLETLVAFTPGDTGANSVVINMRGDAAREAVSIGASAFLQENEVEMIQITNRKYPRWEQLVQRFSGASNLGVRSIRRTSIREHRGQNWARGW